MSEIKAIEKIKEEFPNDSKTSPEKFIKKLRGDTDFEWESSEKMRKPIAKFLEKHLRKDNIVIDYPFNLIIELTEEQIGKEEINKDISVFIEIGILFGVLWQHQDIINTLKEEVKE